MALLSSQVIVLFICFVWPALCQFPSLRNATLYTIVAPSKLRPNIVYHVCCTVHDVPDPVDFTIQIYGLTDVGVPVSVLRNILVVPKHTEIVDFELDDWQPGNYTLEVIGRGGISFQNSTKLEFEHRSYSVFIQTDRAVYKPGQLVQFRAIAVDPYLVPTPRPTVVDLSVRDAHGNLIQEWNRVQTRNGVASADFSLADGPVLGDWTVHVNIEGQKFQKNFTVAEFILPTFEVAVEVPKYVTYNKSDVVTTIKAMYSFGKPVKGELTLTVAPRTRYNKLTVRPYESFQTKAKIDGIVDIYLNLLQDLSLRTDFFKREIEFFALVEEEETGHKYNTTNTMWIYDKEIKVELIRTSSTFKPGLKYTAFLKVAYQDNTPVSESRNNLQLKYGYSLRENEWKTISYTVPRNGLIRLEFLPPNEEDISFLTMRAEYQGQTYYIDRTEAATSPSNNFLQVVLVTPNPKVQQTVEMEVNATENFDHLIFQVIGRGNIHIARTIPVPNQKVYRFSFRATNKMAPRARVLVYYIRKRNNEVVADSVSFDVEGLFRTSVTVSTSGKEVQPGSPVNIRLQSEPNAFIGILGVDQGILELKSGNDITQSDIIADLETYDGGQETKYRPPWYRRRRRRSLWWPGSKSAGLIFKDSGTVILTNALLSLRGSEGGGISLLLLVKDCSLQPNASHAMIFAEDDFPENVIYIDESALNTPIQPPSELPGAIVKDSFLIVRKKYPETWLWLNTTTGGDGTASVSHSVPEALTSWVISAFAVHPIEGLGVTFASSQVTVYRPFFITMSLPYVVLMGEDLAIQVVVFNYNKNEIRAEVTMENRKKEFEFTAAGKDVDDIRNENRRTKIVNIPPSDGVAVSFLIIPLKVGYISIKVIASSTLAGDSLTKRLLVQPEGSTQHFNHAVLVDFRIAGNSKANISTTIPRNAIRDSGKIVLSATGDVMGPSLNKLQNLLFMPTGCGEQNLVTFLPNIIAMKYLSRINKLTPSFKNKAVNALKNGYQRQLTYRRQDGSFSTFGERDRSGSTWLTAYAIKSLNQARPYIVIDPDIITKGMEWIIRRQNSDGSFEEPGEVHHKALQGGEANGAALTSFVLMALLENEDHERYHPQITKAQQYIERELSSINSPYVIAIATYALHLSDSSSRDRAYQMMLNLAEKEDDVMYWSNKENEVNITDKQSDYFYLAPSLDVESTAYALLTLAHRFDIETGVPILRWLILKQNENGGYSSSQATVVALQAISQMAPLMLSLSTDITVKYKYQDQSNILRVVNANAMSVQSIDIPPTTPFVELEISGSGVGVVQVSWSFNLAVSGETPAFFLNALLDKTSTESYLQLSICSHQRERKEISSNMAVMEVGLPSGYVADVDALPSILQIPKVKKVETQLEDTKVIIYLDRLDKEESCVTVPAHRTHKVARQRRAPVRLYDYYNQAQSSRMFYRPHKTSLCDICDDNDCGDCIKQTVDKEGENSPLEGSGTSSYHMPPILILTLVCLIHTVH